MVKNSDGNPDESGMTFPAPKGPRESVAGWLGINRATLAVLVVIGGLGLSEEIWRNFLAIHLKDSITGVNHAAQVLGAVKYMGIFAVLVNLLEGFGYIIGGAVAHRLGARSALLVSALPMILGFTVLIATRDPLFIVVGALLITNWESLSVPATFDVVGSEVPKDRRTIAFAMQSIQKRLPKVLGPLLGGIVMAIGYWVNITLAFGLVALSCIIQFTLLNRMKPKDNAEAIPLSQVLKNIPPDLRRLLTAEIILRWGEWFVRDFAVLYVVGVLMRSTKEAGVLIALTSFTALLTYIPMGKIIDRAPSAKPYIGITFFLFALFPINMVLLPKILPPLGIPMMGALALVFVLNGLRELGEPARKALISGGFPKEIRARAVGLYWGLRSFAFCPAPLVAYGLWNWVGPDVTFLIGGVTGMAGAIWFWRKVKCLPESV
ncbi:MAG: MFS transporter [Deltaproteobacteria bacterium]|nr:MFS transporter [Deltaproteobacteria bacterium]